MTDLQNTKAQLVYRVANNEYERVNPLTLADIVQIEENESATAENIINYINNLMQTKADKSTTLSGYGITDAYTKTEADNKFAQKSTTLSGYGITDAYTKTEVDGKIAELINFRVEVVSVLPQEGQTNVLYLVPKEGVGEDIYNEYVWIVVSNVGHYEFLGTTQVDLSNYYTKSEVDTLLSGKLSNTATGNLSLTILGTASTGTDATNVGIQSAAGWYATSLGRGATASGTASTVIGRTALANQTNSVAIGTAAQSTAIGAIALGAQARNSEDKTFKVALTDKNDNTPAVDESTGLFTLLESNGKIPAGRYNVMVGADGEAGGVTGSVPAPSPSDNTKYLRGDGTWQTVDALPSQAGNSGKFLTTDGTNASWANAGVLPSQTNNQGKVLFTNGTDAEWEKPSFSKKITLTSVGWDGENKQVIRVNGMGIDDIVLVNPKPTIDGVNESTYTSCKVRAIDQQPNLLTFYCDTKPSSDLIVTLGVIRVKEYLSVLLSVDQDDASIETWITETNPDESSSSSSS